MRHNTTWTYTLQLAAFGFDIRTLIFDRTMIHGLRRNPMAASSSESHIGFQVVWQDDAADPRGLCLYHGITVSLQPAAFLTHLQVKQMIKCFWRCHSLTLWLIDLQVIAFAADEKYRLKKAIKFADVYHSANRYSTGGQSLPVVLPRSITWSFQRQRPLLGRELLRCQGLCYHATALEPFTESQLGQLAGNAFLNWINCGDGDSDSHIFSFGWICICNWYALVWTLRLVDSWTVCFEFQRFAGNVILAVVMGTLASIRYTTPSEKSENEDIADMVAGRFGEDLSLRSDSESIQWCLVALIVQWSRECITVLHVRPVTILHCKMCRWFAEIGAYRRMMWVKKDNNIGVRLAELRATVFFDMFDCVFLYWMFFFHKTQ